MANDRGPKTVEGRELIKILTDPDDRIIAPILDRCGIAIDPARPFASVPVEKMRQAEQRRGIAHRRDLLPYCRIGGEQAKQSTMYSWLSDPAKLDADAAAAYVRALEVIDSDRIWTKVTGASRDAEEPAEHRGPGRPSAKAVAEHQAAVQAAQVAREAEDEHHKDQVRDYLNTMPEFYGVLRELLSTDEEEANRERGEALFDAESAALWSLTKYLTPEGTHILYRQAAKMAAGGRYADPYHRPPKGGPDALDPEHVTAIVDGLKKASREDAPAAIDAAREFTAECEELFNKQGNGTRLGFKSGFDANLVIRSKRG